MFRLLRLSGVLLASVIFHIFNRQSDEENENTAESEIEHLFRRGGPRRALDAIRLALDHIRRSVHGGGCSDCCRRRRWHYSLLLLLEHAFQQTFQTVQPICRVVVVQNFVNWSLIHFYL